MSKKYLRNPQRFVNVTIDEYKIVRHVHSGNNGLVYYAVREDIDHAVACKLIPTQNLRHGWQAELTKSAKLTAVDQVVKYIRHGQIVLDGQEWVWMFWEWVDGDNLGDYVKKNPSNMSIAFIQAVLNSVLRVFLALKVHKISHGDLHAGNVLIAAPDPSMFDPVPRIKVTDFGVGCSLNDLKPKDDYEGLARICHELLRQLDPAELEPEDRFMFSQLSSFLLKDILEVNVTTGEFVREPYVLLTRLQELSTGYQRNPDGVKMLHPFDYLSCEQIGDSFEKLRLLYSGKFPGSYDLVQFTNTVLTGPRGCGKTTVFKNLSLVPQMLSGQITSLDETSYVGVYYHCIDLYYAFPYLKSVALNEYQARATVHYFNVALLRELTEMLMVMEERIKRILPPPITSRLEEFLGTHLPGYTRPPAGTNVLRHIKSFAEREKVNTKTRVERSREQQETDSFSGLDFLKQLSGLLQSEIPAFRGRPIFFFLDDYSSPKVSESVQASLSRVIFQRNSECFFKVSTESVTTLNPQDYDGKLLEETREYDLIDLGDYFLSANDADKTSFLVEVINNRLRLADSISHKDITRILGPAGYPRQTDLARAIRSGGRVLYSGLATVVDLCSGDVMSILRLIRDMFAQGLPDRPDQLPLTPEVQDKQIRKLGADFLQKIESAPEFGPQMRQIALAFGDVAHYQMLKLDSGNGTSRPPKQAFRIEMRETPTFPDDEMKRLYQELIRYGVFIRDVRGKSVRGAVVPRLYLRRLLIPTFKLTFSQRDNIGLEPDEFLLLLRSPDQFRDVLRLKTLKGLSKDTVQGRLDI